MVFKIFLQKNQGKQNHRKSMIFGQTCTVFFFLFNEYDCTLKNRLKLNFEWFLTILSKNKFKKIIENRFFNKKFFLSQVLH